MSYTKINWKAYPDKSTPLSAENLNKMDNQIFSNTDDIATIKTDLGGKASTSVVTTSANGLMSSADKTKLDGIATGANKTTVTNNLTSTSTTAALSAAQGKALNDSISNINSNLSEIQNHTIGSSVTREFGVSYVSPSDGYVRISCGYQQLTSNGFFNISINGKVVDSWFPFPQNGTTHGLFVKKGTSVMVTKNSGITASASLTFEPYVE